MLKNHVNTIALILAILIAGCGSPATSTPVPPTQAPPTEPSPMATPVPEPAATGDTRSASHGEELIGRDGDCGSEQHEQHPRREPDDDGHDDRNRHEGDEFTFRQRYLPPV